MPEEQSTNTPTPSGDGGGSNVTPPSSPSGGGTTAPPTGPTGPLTLKDDQEVLFGEGGKPFKVSDLRGLQSQFTKVSQARAELDRQLKAQREDAARLQNALKVALGQAVQPPQSDPFADIKDRPFITGQQLAALMSQSQNQITSQLNPVGQVLQVMAQRLLALEGQFGTVAKDYSGRAHEQKIRGALSKIGLDPDEYFDEADIFYRAHEGDTLDEDFPSMFKEFVEKRTERQKRLKQQRMDQARQMPFVPGKGGFGSTKGDHGLTGKETPQELADKMWALMQGNDT